MQHKRRALTPPPTTPRAFRARRHCLGSVVSQIIRCGEPNSKGVGLECGHSVCADVLPLQAFEAHTRGARSRSRCGCGCECGCGRLMFVSAATAGAAACTSTRTKREKKRKQFKQTKSFKGKPMLLFVAGILSRTRANVQGPVVRWARKKGGLVCAHQGKSSNFVHVYHDWIIRFS